MSREERIAERAAYLRGLTLNNPRIRALTEEERDEWSRSQAESEIDADDRQADRRARLAAEEERVRQLAEEHGTTPEAWRKAEREKRKREDAERRASELATARRAVGIRLRPGPKIRKTPVEFARRWREACAKLGDEPVTVFNVSPHFEPFRGTEPLPLRSLS